ncbi:MAG: D-alanyl-D-alanine carboxypeptidase [Bacteroidota bacterium]
MKTWKDKSFSFNILKISALGIILVLSSCAGPRLSLVRTTLDNDNFVKSLHGWVVFDPAKEKVIHNTFGHQYFIPASNTKIATLYTCHILLKAKSPALEYLTKNDTLYFRGNGYPALAHPKVGDSVILPFLKSSRNVVWVDRPMEDNRFGPGWAWEDFDRYFSAEKSVLPLYGNTLTLLNGDFKTAKPNLFQDSIYKTTNRFRRAEYRNQFYVPERFSDTLTIPLKVSKRLTQQLLEDLTQKKVLLGKAMDFSQKKVLPGIATDSILKEMLWKSDNFLAEQLLVMASSTLSDTLGTRLAIKHILNGPLKDLKDAPRWVDGSGLSRYNLFTPMSFVQILQKLQKEIPEQRLLTLFPNWTINGTVGRPNPAVHFIYAKSGSMGNVYNLSGYLKTKSGKILIFSFMNNHFRIPSAVVRQKMYQTLEELHERY